MYIAIRKEPNGRLYMDKNFFERYTTYDLGRYNYAMIEIKDEYFDTIKVDDFNDNLTLNEEKYLERIEIEKSKRFGLDYENMIVELIRKKYSLNQELAILRQRDTKPEEFAEYNDYVEQCKQEVKNNTK
jgi:hypothetical protein